MTPATINAVGFVAGLCGIVGFVPQLFKIVRDKDAREVSRAMYAITTLGFVLWVTFGVLNHSWPVIASNSVMLILAATILGLTLKYGKGPPSR